MGSVFLKFLAGAAAGLLTGVLTEPSAPPLGNDGAWGVWEIRTLLLLGALLGAFVGLLDGLSRGGAVWIGRSLGLGTLFGMVGATLGYQVGGRIAGGLLGPSWYEATLHPMPVQMMGHTLVFLSIGVLIGAGVGASSLNPKKIVQGATGGLVGGAVAGILFDPIGSIVAPMILAMRGQTSGEAGGPSRMIGWFVLGAMVALMIGLVDRFARKAWLRADFGRNESKEWPLDAAQNFVGRGETCHVILRSDPLVAPVHASIAQQGRHFVISDAGSPAGTFVNGHRIGQASLNPGDVVQIGSFALRFMVKGQQTAYVPHMQAPPQPTPISPPYPSAGMPPQQTSSTPYGIPTGAMPPQPSPMSTGQPNGAFAAAPVAPSLVALDGPYAGRRFPVIGPIEIGREASGIALTGDPNASRRHASVLPGAGGLQVDDLGSTNGTFVDGARVQSALARPGSTVRVGSTTFRVE